MYVQFLSGISPEFCCIIILFVRAVTAQSVWLWATGWTIGVLGFDSRGGGAGNFSLNHRIQNGSGAHPASYPMGSMGPFPGGKAAGA
jgi:hypothetical protein